MSPDPYPHVTSTCTTRRAPWALLVFCALLPLGFAYVAVVLCGRSSPFASRVDPWGDWLGVTLSGPALYLLAAHPLHSARLARPAGFAAWGFMFFAGLHWEWIGRLTGAHFSLTAHDMARLTSADLTMLLVAAVLILALLSHCFVLARRGGFLLRWVLSFGTFVLLFPLVTLLLGSGWRFHLHHYFWALCLAPFIRFPSLPCLCSQAFLIGVYVEGAGRWGMAPIWNRA